MTIAAGLALPLVRAEGISVTLGGESVLAHVDLTLRPHEIVTLVGPNGAGKTTLVRTILGLIRPDRGRIEMRPGLRIGYMPQFLELDPTLPITVERFLRLAGEGLGPRIGDALGEVGAPKVANRPLQGLSGGEMQRVLLARALLRDPDLLVLDEPVKGVDLGGQAELYELIGRLRRQRGCGVLMVSHDLHLVMGETDQVICLNRHVCCAGHPEAVSRHPEYVALFGARLAEKVAVYTHRHDHAHDLHGDPAPLSGGHRHVHGEGCDHG